MDVVTTFLNGKLEELIFMRQPLGFQIPGQEHLVCRLRHSIYGLKQSPRTWYYKIDTYLLSSGWACSFADPNLYYVREEGTLIILMLFIDDLLVTGNNPACISQIKDTLQEKYQMKDLGLVQHYLGIEFLRTSSGLLLHLRTYIQQMLEETGMSDSRIEFIPLPLGHLLMSETNTPTVDVIDYYHIVGKLIFLLHSHPDISYAIGVVSRYMSKPQQSHWESVLHILCYLNYTRDLGIFFKAGLRIYRGIRMQTT